MPYDEPDPTDPMMLVGVELPADPAAATESCRVFAEEFARMGYDRNRLLALFQNPHFSGPHRLLVGLGEKRVQAVIDEVVSVWGQIRFRDVDGRGATDSSAGACETTGED